MKDLSWLLVLLFFIFVSETSLAQDPVYSQFYAGQVYTNPASAGATAGGRFVHSHRFQWPGLPGKLVTATEAYDQYFETLRGGIALIATFDRAGEGILKTSHVGAAYALEQKLNDGLAIRVGFQASFVQKSIDLDKLTFNSMVEPRDGFMFPNSQPLPSREKNFSNFATGVLLCSEWGYAGLAVHNITQPDLSLYGNPTIGRNLPVRFTAQGGVSIPIDSENDLPISERVTINPNLMLMKQKDFDQTNVGFYIRNHWLTTGLGMRFTSQNTDAAIVLIGLNIKKMISIAYSYDMLISGARFTSAGSHEFSLTIKWRSLRSQGVGSRIISPAF